MALTCWSIKVSWSSQDALLSKPVNRFKAIGPIGSPQIKAGLRVLNFKSS
jgi:hypothetical protein